MRLTLALACALALSLPASAAAPQRIVPQRGIAGVRLGMTKAHVRALRGTPLLVLHGRNDFGPYTEFRYPFLLRVLLQGNATVTGIDTTGRKYRTRAGVGVGSTERDVRRKLGGVRCVTEFGFRHCFVGLFRPGRRVTDFHVRRGRVTRVVIGFVLD
jgi:hypothetical protein